MEEKHLKAQNAILPLVSATPERSREGADVAQPSGCAIGLHSQKISHFSKYPGALSTELLLNPPKIFFKNIQKKKLN